MSRLQNYVAIFLGLIALTIGQFLGATVVEDVGDSINSSADNLEVYSGEEVIHDVQVSITKWVPLVGGFGLIAIGVVNEFRRQRVGRREPRRPP